MKLDFQNLVDVSVVVSVRNESQYLREALDGILAQSGCTFELVLVDDHSTDDTYDIAKAIAIENPGMVVSKNPGHGKCAAFNYGVTRSRGRYVCLFAGDDIMPAGSLNARLRLINDLPNNKPVVGLSKLMTMSDIPRYNGHLVPRGKGRGSLSGVSPLMNRIAVSRIFPVPESLPNEDSWMELALLHLPDWTLIQSDIICCKWRMHANNSINLSLPFIEYDRKITARQRALPMFYEKNFHQMSEEGRRKLSAKIRCEEKRMAGNVWGVLLSSVGFVQKLRALSITNSSFYNIRKTFYGLLSGW